MSELDLSASFEYLCYGFNSFSVGIVFRRQNMTSKDVRFWKGQVSSSKQTQDNSNPANTRRWASVGLRLADWQLQKFFLIFVLRIYQLG